MPRLSGDVTYRIVDFYNWDKNIGQESGTPISQRDLWELHLGGYAKDFLVEGTSNLMITWESGQRWNTGATFEVQNEEEYIYSTYCYFVYILFCSMYLYGCF